MKGNLSVASKEALLIGGKAGPAVVAGQPESGELLKRVMLDPAHEDFMPADGKTPLTKEEITLITWWIKNGQAATGKTLASYQNFAEIKPLVASYLGLAGGAIAGSNNAGFTQSLNPEIPSLADTSLVRSLRAQGLMVRYMLKKPVMLDVTLPDGSDLDLSRIKKDLLKLSKNIIWLDLSGNDLSPSDLDFLKLLSNLEKLRLDKTPVTDEICNQLLALKHLEVVNLSQTRITAKTIETLKQNPAIKKVYTWGSNAPSLQNNAFIN
jgi:hypothetical protein